VQQARHDFLAGARLAKNQHFGVGPGGRRHIIAKGDDAGAFSN
jgi:hypothetical protein